jgi:hypothetical protein
MCAWRSNVPLSIHGDAGEGFWGADHKTLVRGESADDRRVAGRVRKQAAD